MVNILKRGTLPALAYHYYRGDDETQPLVMFLGGYKSDMEGAKALYLEEQCKSRGQAYLRFDYSGHGQSGGRFEDGVISFWRDDALDIYDHIAKGREAVLVGSSMGGWIAFLCALARPNHMKGIVGIAAAPDFTLYMMRDQFTDQQKHDLETKGYADLPNDYSDEPYRVTKALIDDGAKNAVLEQGMDLNIPVHLIQGKCDADVPWNHANSIKNALSADSVQITFIEDGDHRLSRANDLKIIDQAVRTVSGLQ